MPRPPAQPRKRARSASAASRHKPAANKLIANLFGAGLFLLLFPVVMANLRTPILVPGLQLLALGGAFVLYRVLMAQKATLPT